MDHTHYLIKPDRRGSSIFHGRRCRDDKSLLSEHWIWNFNKSGNTAIVLTYYFNKCILVLNKDTVVGSPWFWDVFTDSHKRVKTLQRTGPTATWLALHVYRKKNTPRAQSTPHQIWGMQNSLSQSVQKCFRMFHAAPILKISWKFIGDVVNSVQTDRPNGYEKTL